MSERDDRPFYLVQRLQLSPLAGKPLPEGPLGKMGRNPFGYGTMGDYDLEYMGAAEFEWGAIPEAAGRLKDAGKGLVLTEWEYGGYNLDFLYIEREGEPFAEWTDWAEGRYTDPFNGEAYDVAPFDGKERPYELEQRLNGEDPPKWADGEWRTAIWWALRGNVLWAFHEDGHLPRLLETANEKATA